MIHAIWAVCIAVAVAAIAYNASQYEIERAKQDAFMMKACVDAGGQWVKNLGPTWNCVRPKED